MSNLSIKDKLKLLKEGHLLLEAPDDRYDLPNNIGNNQDEDDVTEPNNPPQETNTPDTDPQDPPEEDDDIDAPVTSDNEDQDVEQNNEPVEDADEENTDDASENITGENNKGKPGEVLTLDDTTRAMLEYKNFVKFRELRDSVSRILNEFSNLQTSSDEVRSIIAKAIEVTKDLLDKLNDYIIYRYTKNSYEINYKNYVQFISEKILIDKLWDSIMDKTKNIENK